MQRFRPFHPIARRLGTIGLISAILVLASGCTTKAPSHAHGQTETFGSSADKSASELIPVVRYGRYTLVELVPEAAQQDLLLQVIDVSMPATLPATVGEALRYVLLRSGYTLCEASSDAAVLHDLPLPAAHLRLGPLFLRDALLTLAGPAWELQVDDVARRVCFTQEQEPLP
jgi:type IV pili sensor histidine kinase/response regulator